MGLFSVIIATRNRPGLFARALDSVQRQNCEDFEIIVVNDGSDDAHLPEYQNALEIAARPIQFHSLVHRPKGHGPGYVQNFAAAMATGRYLCFLDDDDTWTDESYLSRITTVIARLGEPPDLLFSSQAAFFHDQREEGPIWLEGLATQLQNSSRQAEEGGFYRVTVEEILGSGGFCHINSMIVRRALFDAVGGMDESIRWEQDHDFFLRLIDRAKAKLLSPVVVSRHNIPDPAKGSSSTTSLGTIERRLYQLRVFDKAILFACHPEIRSYARKQKGYKLKGIAETLVANKDYRAAAFYAREALGAAPTLKWAAYTGLISLRSLVG